MENLSNKIIVSDVEFVLNLIENMLIKQENNIFNYMNECSIDLATKSHFENIFYEILTPKGTLARIKMEMLADGRSIK